MKKALSIAAGLVILLYVDTIAQKKRDKTDTLFIEISDNKYIKTISDGKQVRHLDEKCLMQIQVKDINPFLYNITMKEYQNDYLNEMKNENIQTLNYSLGNLIINFPETNAKTFNVVDADNAFKTQVAQLEDSIESRQRRINDIYRKIINPYKDSIAKSKDSTSLINRLQDTIDKADYLVADLVNEKNKFKQNLSGVAKDNKKLRLSYLGQKNFAALTKEYNKKIGHLQKLFNFYQALKINVYTPGRSCKDLAKDKVLILREYLSGILNIKAKTDSISHFQVTHLFHSILNEISEISQKLQSEYFNYMQVKGKTSEETELALSMKDYLNWLSNEQKKININSLDNIITTTVLLYNSITCEMFSYNYTIDEIKEKTDFVKFLFDATPKTQNQSSIVPKPISYKVTMPVKGGTQMNVSSGIFFNFGLSNQDWFYKPINTVADTFQLKKSKYSLGDAFTPSVGLLLHIYKRSPYSSKFAGSIGFSTNAKEINYYLGGSLIFGKSQRFVVTAGVAGGQKDVLKPNFGEGLDNNYVTKDFKVKNEIIQTVKKFKVGAFLSFTFNLWGKATKEFNFESNIAGTQSGNQ